MQAEKKMDFLYSLLLLIFSNLSVAVAFTPAAHDSIVAMTPMASAVVTTGIDAISSSLSSLSADTTNSLFISMAEESESVTRQGLINWGNPAEAVGGAITLLYIVFSILAGIKYVVKDGWRPKF